MVSHRAASYHQPSPPIMSEILSFSRFNARLWLWYVIRFPGLHLQSPNLHTIYNQHLIMLLNALAPSVGQRCPLLPRLTQTNVNCISLLLWRSRYSCAPPLDASAGTVLFTWQGRASIIIYSSCRYRSAHRKGPCSGLTPHRRNVVPYIWCGLLESNQRRRSFTYVATCRISERGGGFEPPPIICFRLLTKRHFRK